MNTVNNMKDPAAQTELPAVMTFKDLHVPESLEQAKASLKGKSGIYCFHHITSGKKYIGQAVDLSVRLIDHIKGRESNIHLQRARKKYGVNNFEFIVVEFVENTSLLTTREQLHLDWLFSLSSELRYNICPTASSMLGYTHTAEALALMSERKSGENHPMYGKTHSDETKALMSERKSGENHPMFGKTHSDETKALMSERLSGENHPMFGKTHAASSIELNRLNQPNRKNVFIYDLSNKLVGEHPTIKAAASALNCSISSIFRKIDTGKRLRKSYLITSIPLP